MKKNSTILSLFLLFGSLGMAQPVYNSLKVPAYNSTVSAYSRTDTTADQGPAGANQVWDYSTVKFSGSPSTSTIVNPSTTGYASSFPTANYSEQTPDGNYSFFNMTTTSQTLLGERDNVDGVTIVYSDPLKVMQLPFNYNAIQTDNYSTSNLTINGIPTTMTGSLTIQYDGYGTLKTMFGTYTNVMRFKMTKVDTSIINYVGIEVDTIIESSVTYSWNIPSMSTMLFSIQTVTEVYNGVPMGSENILMLTAPASITADKNLTLQNLSISVGPNPATDKVTIAFNDLASDEYSTQIINQQGSLVMSQNGYYAAGSTQTTDISKLERGIYIIRVTSSRGSAVQKLIKE